MIPTLFLAKLLGLFLFFISLAVLTRRAFFVTVLNDLSKNQSYLFFTGFFLLFLGLLVVLVHNIWVMNWFVLITLIGWFFVLNGLFRIFFPSYCAHVLTKVVNHPSIATIIATILFLISLYLLYFGFTW